MRKQSKHVPETSKSKNNDILWNKKILGFKSALYAVKERGEYGMYSVSIIDCP